MWQNPTLFPAVTNRESVVIPFAFYDDDTGDPIDISEFTFVFELRRPQPGPTLGGDGYSTYSDLGSYDTRGPALALSLDSGITITDVHTLEVEITPAQSRTLAPMVYEVGFVVSTADGLESRQILLGKLPVLFGGTT